MATNNGSTSENRGPATLAVTIAMLICSTIFITLRVISRTSIVHRFSWDDYFIVAAWCISLGLSITICYGTSVGLGRHETGVPSDWETPLKKSEYVFSVLYNPALMLTKTSILVFYLTLSQTQKLFRYATLITLAVVNLGGLALTILNIAQCRPVQGVYENPVPQSAHCIDILSLYLSSAPLNIITDLAMLVLPMPVLTSMRLPRKQKIILIVTFSFGLFIAVVDVVRIAYLQSAATNRLQNIQNHSGVSGSSSRNSESNDFSWYGSYTLMWSAVEVHVGMMCACVPSLKPLVSRFLPYILRDAPDDKTKALSSNNGVDSLDVANAQRQSPHQSPHPDMPMPQPPEAAHPPAQDGGAEPMGMLDFLTTPDMAEFSPDRPQSTATATTARLTRSRTPTFFDFVNVKRRKSMVHMTNKESYFPFAAVTVLFFVWGFAYGLLDVLNGRFQQAAGMTSAQSIGIHSAYFGGYFVAPVTFGRLVFKHWGFKACYMVGLVVYACGTLVFWPSAVLSSFPAFLVSNFIVGLGLSTLEIAANPFIALCGPPQYAEVRLNLSQGIQAVGTVLSPLLAEKVLFKVDATSLIDVQWTYLGISLFTVLLALGYYYVPLPEATDAELADFSDRADNANNAYIQLPFPAVSERRIPVVYVTLALGALSQFCYLGGQETVSTTFQAYLKEVDPKLNYVNHQAIGHSAFAISRFLAAFLNLFFILPRHLLLIVYVCATATSALSMAWSGTPPATLIILVYFFEGPIFSLLFAMCLRGMGRHTKDASTIITAAISGGAVFPPIAYGAATGGRGAQYGMCVVVAAFAAGALMAVYLEVFPKASRIVDPIRNPDELPETEGTAGEEGAEERWQRELRQQSQQHEHEHEQDQGHMENIGLGVGGMRMERRPSWVDTIVGGGVRREKQAGKEHERRERERELERQRRQRVSWASSRRSGDVDVDGEKGIAEGP